MRLDEEIKRAKENFMKHGEVIPIFIFYAGEERWLMSFSGEDFNEEAKLAFSLKAKMINLALDCHAYTFISEIWCRTLPYEKGDKIDPIVADKPDKIEGIMLIRESHDHKEGAMIEIIRQGGKVELKENDLFKQVNKLEGRFSDLLPPRKVREAVPEEDKEILKTIIMSEGVLYRG